MPFFSACSIIDFAIRSLTDPKGFWFSNFANNRTRGLGDKLETSTSGVLPIKLRTFSKMTIASGYLTNSVGFITVTLNHRVHSDF